MTHEQAIGIIRRHAGEIRSNANQFAPRSEEERVALRLLRQAVMALEYVLERGEFKK